MLLFMCKYTLILLLSKEKVKNYNPEPLGGAIQYNPPIVSCAQE